MKVEFYIDVYRGQTIFYPNPWPSTSNVSAGHKRIKFSVEIDMDKLFPPDVDLGAAEVEVLNEN